MKKYRCKKDFSVDNYTEDGFELENKYFEVECNSIWELYPDDFRVIGGEIRLINDYCEWLEISRNQLKELFEEIE